MTKETKDLIITMIQSWNQFNPRKAVKVHFDDSEFSPKHWSLDMAIEGVISSKFMSFLLPALIAHNCHWFLSAYGSEVIFHIQ